MTQAGKVNLTDRDKEIIDYYQEVVDKQEGVEGSAFDAFGGLTSSECGHDR